MLFIEQQTGRGSVHLVNGRKEDTAEPRFFLGYSLSTLQRSFFRLQLSPDGNPSTKTWV
jgi:hypothetical protein